MIVHCIVVDVKCGEFLMSVGERLKTGPPMYVRGGGAKPSDGRCWPSSGRLLRRLGQCVHCVGWTCAK